MFTINYCGWCKVENDFLSSINKIEEAILNNKLVIFVGAGVSKNSGYPGWGELISIIKKDLNLDKEEQDYLKIAQLYYNKWGEKQYYSLISSVFEQKERFPNIIHELIFEINPQHIITTNYDNLLEKQMVNSNKRFHLVRKDRDIAYDKNNRMIIKMHGDLSEKNVVLKEDDYTNYTRNFKLIELYIKSLLTNHTFLFLGYSLNDYNFNLIFQSIKSELNTDFQRAFFFDASEIVTDLEKNYYLNKGINIFTIEDGNSDGNFLPDKKGNKLAIFLSFLSRRSDDVNKFPDNEKELLNKISLLEELNFYDPRLLTNLSFMKDKFYDSADNSIQDLKNSVFDLEDEHVIRLLKKSNLETFLGSDLQKKEISTTDNNGSIEFLKSPYQLYLKKDYKNAREKFRVLANYYFERRSYFLALLCDFNFKQLDKLVKFSNPYSKADKKEEEGSELDTSKLSNKKFERLKEEFLQIATEEEKRGILFFEDVFNFSYLFNTYYKIDQIVEKLISIKKTYSNNGFNYSADLVSLINSFENFRSFICENYVCVKHYSEYKNICKKYIEGLLISFSTKISEDGFFQGNGSATIEELDRDDISLIIENFSTSDLDHYFYKHGLTSLKVNEEAVEFISEFTISELDKKVWNFIDGDKIILPLKLLLRIEIQNILPIVNLTKKISEESKVIEHIENSLKLLYKNFALIDTDSRHTVEEILESYLKYFVDQYLEKGSEARYKNSLKILGSLMNKMELRDKFEIEELNSFLFLIIHGQKNVVKFIDLQELLLANFFAFSTSTQHKIIEVVSYVERNIENNKIEVNSQMKDLFIEASLSGIYDFSDLVCEKILLNIKETILKSNATEGMFFPDPIELALIDLVNLYRSGKINLDMMSFLTENKEKYTGKRPEVDWNIFKSKNEVVLSNIFKIYKDYNQIIRLFVDEEKDKQLIDEYIIKNFTNINLS